MEGSYSERKASTNITLTIGVLVVLPVDKFDLIGLFYMDSLNETRSLFYNKVHEVKKALIKGTSPVNRVHLTVLVSIKKIYILGVG